MSSGRLHRFFNAALSASVPRPGPPLLFVKRRQTLIQHLPQRQCQHRRAKHLGFLLIMGRGSGIYCITAKEVEIDRCHMSSAGKSPLSSHCALKPRHKGGFFYAILARWLLIRLRRIRVLLAEPAVVYELWGFVIRGFGRHHDLHRDGVVIYWPFRKAAPTLQPTENK